MTQKTIPVSFADTVLASQVRMTDDGYMVASCRVARSGIQHYLGSEVGMPERQIVRVYRPPEVVFADAAMASYASKPITNDHPPGGKVTAATWKRDAVGSMGTTVMRDGEFVRVDLALMDQAAIADYKRGKRQLSAGYDATLVVEPGTSPEGEEFDAYISDQKVNHMALVAAARGGDRLTFGDSANLRNPEPILDSAPTTEEETPMKIYVIDGQSIQADDAGLAMINTLKTKLADAETAHGAKLAQALTDAKAASDAEIGRLTAELAEAKKAVLTDAQISERAAALAGLVTQAKTLHDADYTGKSADQIRATVVQARLGDAAANMSAEAIAGAYAALAAAHKPEDPLRQGFADAKPSPTPAGSGVYLGDGKSAEQVKREQGITEAWRNAGAA